MKLRRFLSVVPKAVQHWAVFLVACAVLTGLVVGYKTADQGAVFRNVFAIDGAALVLGIIVAIWLLCIGFVFADARRRDMRPVLWVLVVTFFPHLLGFLLYFVMRQPIAAVCSHCGTRLAHHLRFCAWCGAAQFPSEAFEKPPAATAPQAAGQ